VRAAAAEPLRVTYGRRLEMNAIVAGVGMIPFVKPGMCAPYDEMGAQAVRAALADEPHDSTVRTLLRVLKQKGYVRIRGRQPAVYEAAVPRAKVQGTAAKSLLERFFGGSIEALVMRLVEDEELSMAELARLNKNLARRKRRGGKT
jgi:predicted transcriptional regulator